LLDQLMATGLLLVGDLILGEVLQGFRSEHETERAFSRFEVFEFRTMCGATLR
jgi:hypothetical protein